MIQVADYIVHPDFYLYGGDSQRVDMDYAIIRLSKPAHVPSFAKFPKQGSEPADGTPAIIAGWYVLPLPKVPQTSPKQK